MFVFKGKKHEANQENVVNLHSTLWRQAQRINDSPLILAGDTNGNSSYWKVSRGLKCVRTSTKAKPLCRTATISLSSTKYSKHFTWSGLKQNDKKLQRLKAYPSRLNTDSFSAILILPLEYANIANLLHPGFQGVRWTRDQPMPGSSRAFSRPSHLQGKSPGNEVGKAVPRNIGMGNTFGPRCFELCGEKKSNSKKIGFEITGSACNLWNLLLKCVINMMDFFFSDQGSKEKTWVRSWLTTIKCLSKQPERWSC